jgi:hypothetical protein
MNTSKRQRDPLGRTPSAYPYILGAVAAFLLITGSVWPLSARSVKPLLDSCLPGRSLPTRIRWMSAS